MEDMIKSNPQLTLSGLVPGRLANRFALRTRALRREEGEEVYGLQSHGRFSSRGMRSTLVAPIGT